MELEIKNQDIQSVMQSSPIVALQIENAALRRKLEEVKAAFDAAMMENERLNIATKIMDDAESDLEDIETEVKEK